MYINSPGGQVSSGLAMYDTMQYIRPAIQTLCVGQAASAASLLLCAGAKGQRFSLPNSRIIVHQPSASYHGQATDIARHAQEIVKLKRRLNDIYAKHTGQTLEAVEKALDRDTYMIPTRPRRLGLSTRFIPAAPIRMAGRGSKPVNDRLTNRARRFSQEKAGFSGRSRVP